MIKLWLAFVIVAILMHLAITVWRRMDGKEKLSLTKSIGYSIIIALLTTLVMTVFVIAF